MGFLKGNAQGGLLLNKGVVVEVLYDIGLYDLEKKTQLKENLDPEQHGLFDRAPRNSCIVRRVGSGEGGKTTTFLVLPFFPPHLCFPIKPGETVWLISPEIGKVDPLATYWISRISTPILTDDVNYTHWPRSLNPVTALATSEKGGAKVLPAFLNDGLMKETKEQRQEGLDPFQALVDESESYKNFSPQPVPRFSKRVGDFVIQGSNNALISLGQDRGWKYSDEDPSGRQQSNAVKFAPLEFAGTIDIVAGRSRYLPAEPTLADADGDAPAFTAFPTTMNKRDYIENNKNTKINELDPPPPAEGDPDFMIDAARIYVSQKTSGDINFGINSLAAEAAVTWSDVTEYDPGNPGESGLEVVDPTEGTREEPSDVVVAGLGADERMATGFEAPIEPINDAAYVVVKADEVRIIARKEDEGLYMKDAPEINGSIRLVKEGIKDDDLATVCLLPDGTIQISGSKIFLGRPGDDGGRDAGPGEGGSEPYVRYSDLKAMWDSFMDDFSTFLQGCIDNKSPGYGNPNVVILDAATEFKAAIESTHKPDISTVQSERIFGE